MRLVLIIHLSRRRLSLSHGLKVCPVSARLPYEPLQSGAAQIVSEVLHVQPLQWSFFAGLSGAGLAADCQNGRERNVNWWMLHVKSAYTNPNLFTFPNRRARMYVDRGKPPQKISAFQTCRQAPDNMQRFVNGQGTRSQLNAPVQCVFTGPRRLIKLMLTKLIYFKSAPSLPLMFATISSSCNNLNVNDSMIFLFCGFGHATI